MGTLENPDEGEKEDPFLETLHQAGGESISDKNSIRSHADMPVRVNSCSSENLALMTTKNSL